MGVLRHQPKREEVPLETLRTLRGAVEVSRRRLVGQLRGPRTGGSGMQILRSVRHYTRAVAAYRRAVWSTALRLDQE
jgi:hypothetical protein